MKLIVCLDDGNGMMFNRRRQSRDRLLIEDACRMIGQGHLRLCAYSQTLWEGQPVRMTVSESFLSDAEQDDFCFVENRCLYPYANSIDELVIYRWNRKYPSDFVLDLDPMACGLRLTESFEFAGSSHEKITKEIYRR